jgi:sugar/nucleoside kinase (ribokinase family)
MAVRNFLGVFGHVVLDHILSVPNLPRPDTSVRVTGQNTYFGGTGGNLARCASRLGVSTALASFVGEDFPHEYRQALDEDRVDLTDLRAVPGASMPSAWIFTDPKGNQMTVIDQGPMWDAHRRPLPEHTVRSAQLVHLGTGRPAYHERVARLAAQLGKTIAFDPSQELSYAYSRASFLRLLRKADLFFGNETEVALALRYARLRSHRQLLRYVDQVVVTRGRQGSLVVTREDGVHAIPRVRIRRVRDVTGAGDAYRAGFYAGLARGFDPVRCGILGSTAASFVVEAPGTQTRLPVWDDLVARARRTGEF